jgi:hypothetical protein
MTGFDSSKFGGGDDMTEKYKIGTIMSQFDPKAGVTPEVLAALNALGIAEFSGSAGNLTVNNTKNDPRFGKGGTSDVIRGFDGQNADTAWAPWYVDDGGGGEAQAGGAQGATMGASAPTNYMSTESSLAPMDAEFFNSLMKKMQADSTGDVLDRTALLQQMR